jgi:hypothetical protein
MTAHDHRFPGVTFANIRSELNRTNAASNVEQSIAKGYMTRAGGARQIAIIEALHSDAIRFADAFKLPLVGKPMRYAAPAHGISWHDRRAWLRAELDRRQRTYADARAAGKVTEAAAISQINRLAAMLAIYEDGHDFPAASEDYAAVWYQMLDEIPGRRHANMNLFLDIAAPVAAPTLFGEASGQPPVKGPAYDRPHRTA